MEQHKPNKDFMIQSLMNQLANAHMQIAERDAIITEQYQEIQELKRQSEDNAE